jgi:hypothetical protein
MLDKVHPLELRLVAVAVVRLVETILKTSFVAAFNPEDRFLKMRLRHVLIDGQRPATGDLSEVDKVILSQQVLSFKLSENQLDCSRCHLSWAKMENYK